VIQELARVEGAIMTRADESIYAQLLEHGLDAAFLTRPEDGAILYANPAACLLFGYLLNELRALGRSAVVDLLDPRIREAMAQRRETGRFQGVLSMRRKDGSRFAVALSSVLYTDSSGEQRSSMFVRDLTEQEQREEALRVTNAELSRALTEGRQLQGMLPICCYCKRIRNEEHAWEQVEVYIAAHAPVQFTHSLCPTCYEHYIHPELEQLRRRTP
jgi:PAS domain S-box-containing protein